MGACSCLLSHGLDSVSFGFISADLCWSLPDLCSSPHSTSLILFVSHLALSTMTRSHKRAPPTPKRTPKRSKTKGKQKELPGGGGAWVVFLIRWCILSAWIQTKWPIFLLVSSTAVQASSNARQVHFGPGSSSAAAGGPSGPSRQHEEEDDPFLSSTDHQPLHQVSIIIF